MSEHTCDTHDYVPYINKTKKKYSVYCNYLQMIMVHFFNLLDLNNKINIV